MSNANQLNILDQEMILIPDRALYWVEKKMLIIADPHFGKAQVLRESGIPAPEGTTSDDLGRLSRLIVGFSPKSILILGDLIHIRIHFLLETQVSETISGKTPLD